MSIRLTHIGDVEILRTTPMWNLEQLLTYADTVNGVTVSRTVSKQFRYSFDGVVFTDWLDINILIDVINSGNDEVIANLVTFLSNTDLAVPTVVEVKFERTGTDSSGFIEIVNMTMGGVYVQKNKNMPTTEDTDFIKYVQFDVDVFNLMVNLTEKMYEHGVIPEYFDRKSKENDLDVDKDYIHFWETIAETFAAIFMHGIQFTAIYWRKALLCEFIKQRTLQTCSCDDIVLLQHLAKNYYDEIRQRGTIEIFRAKGFEYAFGSRYGWHEGSDVNIPFVLSPANPIWIDDIRYNEPDELPFGWRLGIDNQEGVIIAPDLNYYDIKVLDNGNVIIIIDPYFDYSALDDEDIEKVKLTQKLSIEPTKDSGIIRKYHGEFLRLICYGARCNEFMFNVVNVENRGWNIGNASPMYKGLRNHNNNTIIKGYENFAEEVYDLRYYPIIGTSGSVSRPPISNQFLPYIEEKYVNPNPLISSGGVQITTAISPNGINERIMRLPLGSEIGFESMDVSEPWFMRISDQIDYEVSFWYKHDDSTQDFRLSVRGFDCDRNEMQFYDSVNGNVKSTFFDTNQQIITNTGQWYFVRYIIFKAGTSFLPTQQPITSLGVGNNLIMSKKTTDIIVGLLNDEQIADIFNFKVKPLRTDFSTGFVQGSDIIEVWRKNNNGLLNDEKVDKIANNLLLPYNSNNIMIKI